MRDLDTLVDPKGIPATDPFRVQLWDVLPGKAEIESFGLGWD